MEEFVRIRFRADFNVLPVSQPGEIGFVRIEMHPEPREIGDRVDPVAGLHIHPFGHVPFHDNAVLTGVYRDMVFDLAFGAAGFLDLINQFLLNAKQPQSVFGGGDVLGEEAVGVASCFFFEPQRLDQRLLRDGQLRAEQLRHVHLWLDACAGVVDVEFINSTRHPGRDIGEFRFVVVDLPGETDRVLDNPPPNGNGANVGQCDRIFRHPQFAGMFRRLSLLERYEVHEADRTLPRARHLDLRMHRTRPE